MATTPETVKATATMNYDQVDDIWKNMELGLILTKKSEDPTQQQQLAQLLDFNKSLRGMKMATEISTLSDSDIYETPNSFTQIIHGDTLKENYFFFFLMLSIQFYPSGLYTSEATTLEEACLNMMDLYCERARIKDGQTILDLGCGPGSLVFHVAKKFKNCKVTGVTNSKPQKELMEEQSKKLNLSNVEIVLADVTSVEMESTFDRVFVIGLIEHMKNFELFLRRVSKWMKDDGLLFLEHYCHKSFSYHCEPLSEDSWYDKHVFPRGTLLIPSSTCLLYFQDDVTVQDHWILSGNQYARSQNEWLKRIDGKVEEIKEIFESFYGISKEEAVKLVNFWRIFCITGAELFGYNNGEEWSISHVLFKKKKMKLCLQVSFGVLFV
ncbi:hypothetical protein MKW92_006269 [Papaver armeniacum]|nr:hypothetical protein MKW92_006269 [Papaver armeniacum]